LVLAGDGAGLFARNHVVTMRRTILTVALALAAGAIGTASRADDHERAKSLFEEAFNRRYRWDENFKGFSADFRATREGKDVRGTIHADASNAGHPQIEVTCDDEEIQALVQSTVTTTVTHTRASRFDKSFASSTFSIIGEGAHGGTKIAISGHGFFKDATIKDGNVIENHGGHGDVASEVRVHQVVLLVESGKVLPREHEAIIKRGDEVQKGSTTETWREFDGVWLPTRYQLRRQTDSAAVETMVHLSNVKVEKANP
jgi:hypothetical protein